MSLKITHTSQISQQSGAFTNHQTWNEAIAGPSVNLRDYTRTLYDALKLSYPKFHKMDDFCRLGFLAAERLLNDVESKVAGDRLGVFLINRYSSLQTDIKFLNSYNKDSQGIPSPSFFVYTLPNILIGQISIRHKITGEHSFFVQQEFGSEFIYLYVQTLFDTGIVDAAVIGYCEVTPDIFGAKMGYVTNTDDMEDASQRFDKNGFEEWINTMP